jgi:RNA polymerase sigma-70 factor (ECF subfamily)
MPPDTSEQNPFLRDPDVRLMLRAREGDQAAFTELVAEYQDRLIGVLIHLLRDRDAAEDLAQDVFLRVYRARGGYEPTARFSTWLFRIANNLARNRRRDTGRHKETGFGAEESELFDAPPSENLIPEKSGLMPTRQFDRTEMRSVVQGALDTLNDTQRMVVLLHRFEEMSYSEIAAALDLSPAAVKSLLSRARVNLREKLEPYMQRGVLGSIHPG